MDDAPDDVTDVQAKREVREVHEARQAPAPQPVPAQAAAAPRGRPMPVFMFTHVAHLIALGCGAGLSRVAPGSMGTLWAWLAWWALGLWLSPAALGWLLLAALPVGWWASRVTARALGGGDPGCIVIDEIVAFWLVLWLLLPAGLWTQCVAFALFRLFDAWKPGPVRWADQAFHRDGWRGAFGIMIDDLVAAALTLLVMALWLRVWA